MEPQAAPGSHVLRGEERLEDPGADVVRDARARIADRDADTGRALGTRHAVLLHRDLEHAAPAHRVRGIHDQVRPDLVELAAEGLDPRPPGGIRATDLDPGLKARPEHHEGALDPGDHVDVADRRAVEVAVLADGRDDLADPVARSSRSTARRTWGSSSTTRMTGFAIAGPASVASAERGPAVPGRVLVGSRVHASRDRSTRRGPILRHSPARAQPPGSSRSLANITASTRSPRNGR